MTWILLPLCSFLPAFFFLANSFDRSRFRFLNPDLWPSALLMPRLLPPFRSWLSSKLFPALLFFSVTIRTFFEDPGLDPGFFLSPARLPTFFAPRPFGGSSPPGHPSTVLPAQRVLIVTSSSFFWRSFVVSQGEGRLSSFAAFFQTKNLSASPFVGPPLLARDAAAPLSPSPARF